MSKDTELILEWVRAKLINRRGLRCDEGLDDPKDWATIEGNKIHFNKNGKVDIGPKAIKDVMNTKKTASAFSKKADKKSIDTTTKNIAKILNNGGQNFNYYGIRTSPKKLKLGAPLPKSRNITLEEQDGKKHLLDGTSSTGISGLLHDADDEDKIRKALNTHIEQGYEGEYHYIIAGDESDYGDDPGELVIRNAIVVGILDDNGNVVAMGKKTHEKPKEKKPKITAEQVEAYKANMVRKVMEEHPDWNTFKAYQNLSHDVATKIKNLMNYSATGNEKFLEGIDLSDVTT